MHDEYTDDIFITAFFKSHKNTEGKKICSCISLKESIHRWKENLVR